MAEMMNTAGGQESNHGSNTDLKVNQGWIFKCFLKQGCLCEIIMMAHQKILKY